MKKIINWIKEMANKILTLLGLKKKIYATKNSVDESTVTDTQAGTVTVTITDSDGNTVSKEDNQCLTKGDLDNSTNTDIAIAGPSDCEDNQLVSELGEATCNMIFNSVTDDGMGTVLGQSLITQNSDGTYSFSVTSGAVVQAFGKRPYGLLILADTSLKLTVSYTAMGTITYEDGTETAFDILFKDWSLESVTWDGLRIPYRCISEGSSNITSTDSTISKLSKKPTSLNFTNVLIENLSTTVDGVLNDYADNGKYITFDYESKGYSHFSIKKIASMFKVTFSGDTSTITITN